MATIDYFNLLVKYSGEIEKATREELAAAAKCISPENPIDALKEAKKMYATSLK